MLRTLTLQMLALAFLCLTCPDVSAQKPSGKAPAESEDMIQMFNGKDLDGWDGDPRLWSVKDGVIHGETTKDVATRGNTFLIYEGGEVEDFELRLSFRCSASNNSGIQYRSQRVEKASNKWVVRGYQHEIRNEENFPNVPSFIYDEKGSRGRICLVGQTALWNEDGKWVKEKPLITAEAFVELMKVDDWNDVVIIAKGNRIQHHLNGRLVLDFTDKHPTKAFSKGVIALQLHGGKPMFAEFKNLRMRKL